ncbi:neogenin, partial [Elysia marginata]
MPNWPWFQLWKPCSDSAEFFSSDPEYFVYQSLDPTLSSKSWKVTASNRMKVKIREVIPYTTYYFRLQARNSVGYGPLSDIFIFRPGT